MSTLLHLNSSLFSDAGQSSQLAARYVRSWQAAHPDGQVRVRDLGADPVPHLTAERFQAFLTPADQRDATQQAIVAESDALIDELASADTVVIGLPMYNFGVPSPLKAWFDHVARAGVSFRYTENGSLGLLPDRKVVVFATRGGYHLGQPSDTQSGHVRSFFGLLGITDIEFVYAEGLAIDSQSRERALQAAQVRIERLAA